MKRRALAIAGAATVALAMFGGQTLAAPNPNSVNHANTFGKDTGDCGVAVYAGGHWTSEFNPSDANQFLRENECDHRIEVIAGAVPLP